MDDILAQAIKDGLGVPLDNTAPPVVPGRKVHIDGDYLAYSAGGNDETTAGEARLRAIDSIDRYKLWSGSEDAVIHLTTPDSNKGERYLVATVKDYQGQRTGHHPKNWQFLRQYLGGRPDAKHWSDREADDGIAVMCYAKAITTPYGGSLDAIAAKDKDMRMIPAVHTDWSTPQVLTTVPLGCYDVIGGALGDLQFGYKWFWLQMLMGDAADHIPGLEKTLNAKGTAVNCGPATADKLLAGTKTAGQAFRIVTGCYEAYYKETWADRFVEQAALLWMRVDEKADVMDFFRHLPVDTIKTGTWWEIAKATHALNLRIKEDRNALNAITNQGTP